MNNAKKTQVMYRFDHTAIELPQTQYKLEIKEGDAWVLFDDHDVVIHAGETITVTQSEHAKLRKLYQNGRMKYKVHTL